MHRVPSSQEKKKAGDDMAALEAALEKPKKK
jgi:hypothetical protein